MKSMNAISASDPVQIMRRLGLVLFLTTLFLSLTLALLGHKVALAGSARGDLAGRRVMGSIPRATVGDVLTRIQCTEGYTAVIYAEGLNAPDGLAFGPDGLLYVAEESAGQVSRIEANGSKTVVVTGLAQPEGLAFDDDGNLYVVEDVDDGRLIKRTPGGVTSTVAAGLDAPEGIFWSADDILYVTESNLAQALSASSFDPDDYRTHVTGVSQAGTTTRILTKTGVVTPSGGFPPSKVEAMFWSYTGDIVRGPDGLLYFSNELSERVQTGALNISIFSIPYTATSHGSIFTTNPATSPASETLFSSGLNAPEGLQFSLDGDFPLYVAEEGGLGENDGQVSLIWSDGSHTPLCTGFSDIEDVVLDQRGWLYVSEDPSGLIIQIKSRESIYLPIVVKSS